MPFKIALLVLSYFLGAIPFSYVVGKWSRGINILEHGSGNAGATNTLRVLGIRLGIVVLVSDFGKGVLAAYIGYLGGGPEFAAWTSLVAILGHTFSVFIHFRGGKGVATAGGALLFLAPDVFMMAFVLWFSIVLLSKYVSLASIAAAIAVIFLSFLFVEDVYVRVLLVIFASYVLYKHNDNIKRLLNGTEKKITLKRKV